MSRKSRKKRKKRSVITKARQCGMSLATYLSSLQELVERGLITKEQARANWEVLQGLVKGDS